MKERGYSGKFIIELYNWSYDDKSEIQEAYLKLTDMLKGAGN